MILLDDYQIKRSNRKSVVACFDSSGTLIVKAPLGLSVVRIEHFLEKNATALWHLKQKTKHKIYLQSDVFLQEFKKFTAINILKQRFEILKSHVKTFGLETKNPPVFKIMQSRWGSCKHNGIICLNLFLGLLPVHLIDAVIAHEFCHLAEMNHSKRFYDLLIKIYPNYKQCDDELKTYVLKK